MHILTLLPFFIPSQPNTLEWSFKLGTHNKQHHFQLDEKEWKKKEANEREGVLVRKY